MMIYALTLTMVPLALGCGAGTGPITATPNMKFTYSPPLAWTWNTVDKAVGGQSLSQESTQNRINSDIESAVKQAVESYGYSTSGISVRNAVNAMQALILPAYTTATACVADNYVPQDMAVTKKCVATEAPTAAAPYNVTGTITVSSPVALAQSNWESIATKVWVSLSNNAGVKFYGLIDVV